MAEALRQVCLPENPSGALQGPEGPRGYAHVLKDRETFAVFGGWGDINPYQAGEHGIFFRDTRYLSKLALRIEDRWPVLLHGTTRLDNSCHMSELISPELREPFALERGAIHIQRTAAVRQLGYRERLIVTSYAEKPVELCLTYEVDADFRDIFEIRGLPRKARGKLTSREAQNELVFDYIGLDQVSRSTRVHWLPSPHRLTGKKAEFRLRLNPRQPTELELRVDGVESGAPVNKRREHKFVGAGDQTKGDQTKEEQPPSACRVRTSNEFYNAWLDRSWSDLRMLSTELSTGRYPFAGLPWFSTIFGRDGIIAAWATLWADPGLARGVLRTLCAYQATASSKAQDAEPGKIVHEVREGEMARCGEVPFGLYYGSVDATPLFVMLADAYLRTSGDDKMLGELWPTLQSALGWLEQFDDGFVTYSPSPDGLLNQGWKDSPGAVVHEDGSQAQGPIALCEVQAYAYGAHQSGARLAEQMGKSELAHRHRSAAEHIQSRFERHFWLEDLQCYALALDGQEKPCRVRTSNAGHALSCGICSSSRAQRSAETLMSPAMFSGWGIRTMASSSHSYNPASYHNGSVWPHDNAFIAEGFARYGMTERAAMLLGSFKDASAGLELRRLPELLCGFDRQPQLLPIPYPSACAPQAWASTSVFQLLSASLGLSVDGLNQQVLLKRPKLPPDLQWVEFEDLPVGTTSVTMTVRRQERTGEVSVAITSPSNVEVRVIS